jgi:hypothetical protein
MSYKTTIEKEWRGKEVKIRGKRVVDKTAFEVGLVVEGQAKLLCAIDTGRLAASITTSSRQRRTLPKGKGAHGSDIIQMPTNPDWVYVGTPVFYGPYIEFGTIKSAAQPFLRPALVLAKGGIVRIVTGSTGKFEFGDFLRKT